MPTQKPRITITMPQEELDKVNAYRFEHRCKNQTQAFIELITAGIESITAESAESPGPVPDDKARLLELFEALNIDGRERLQEIADAMVKSGKYAAPAVPAPAEYIRLSHTLRHKRITRKSSVLELFRAFLYPFRLIRDSFPTSPPFCFSVVLRPFSVHFGGSMMSK